MISQVDNIPAGKPVKAKVTKSKGVVCCGCGVIYRKCTGLTVTLSYQFGKGRNHNMCPECRFANHFDLFSHATKHDLQGLPCFGESL